MKKPTYEELRQTVKELEEEALEYKRAAAKLQRRVVELEENSQRLSHYADQVSQDLQEPLDEVTRYLQFVDARYKDRLDPDAAAFIDSAVDAATRMQGLIVKLSTYMGRKDREEDLG